MSTPLIEAVRQLNLQPGQSTEINVNGYLVQIRRVEKPEQAKPSEEESEYAHMVMVNPWIELPDLPAARIVIAKPGPIDPPDPPIRPAAAL
jgi:hypothetical protein